MNFVVEVEIDCPFCGEVFTSTIDTSQGSGSTIEDCTVCCRPIAIDYECEPGEVFSVNCSRG